MILLNFLETFKTFIVIIAFPSEVALFKTYAAARGELRALNPLMTKRSFLTSM